MPTYRQLDDAQIARTIEELRERIAERFPEANLGRLAEQLQLAAREVSQCASDLRRPAWPIRLAATLAIVALVAVFLAVAGLTLTAPAQMGVSDLVQTIEAGVNDVVFFGIAIFFVGSIETRLKRRRALTLLHELRSLAHIVDMHQLTKDPERLIARTSGETGATLPDGGGSRRATGLDLARYLDFCSELLSLISKVGALLVQDFNDSVVLAGVNEIETLTTGLSSKIWQKITILERTNFAGR